MNLSQRLALLAGLVSAGAALAEAPAGTTPLSLQPLALPIEAPALAPHVVADPARGRFLLSWIERLPDGCARLQVATLSTAGQLGPAHEAARGCDWFVNWADHPQIAVADNGGWWTYWLQKEGQGSYHYGIRVVHSQDEGASWSTPITPHDDGRLAEHGFVSMAADGEDRMRLLWLDGRHADAAADAGGHAHGGAMSLRGAVLDARGAIAEPAELDARTCDCCATALLRTADGGHIGAWRDRSEHEIRDIALARRTEAGWQHLGLIHADNWRINACPVNGPSLARSGEAVFALWPTMSTRADLGVRLQRLGREAPPVSIEHGPGVLGRVDAEGFGEGLLASWLGEGGEGHSALQLAHFDTGLNEIQRLQVTRLPAGRGIGMPRLAAQGDVAVLVWTEPLETPATGGPRPTRLHAVLISASAR